MLHDEKHATEMAIAEELHLRPETRAQEGSFLDPLIVLAKHKLFVLGFAGTAAVLAGIVSLLLPKAYTATAKILPPKESTSIASAMNPNRADAHNAVSTSVCPFSSRNHFIENLHAAFWRLSGLRRNFDND